MKAIIRLDVPDYQIGQPVTVYFKDTMRKTGVCEKDEIVHCNECYFNTNNICCNGQTLAGAFVKPDQFCFDGLRKDDYDGLQSIYKPRDS